MNHFLKAFSDELSITVSSPDLWKLAAAPMSFPTPGSSNVAGYRYDAATKQLFVTYKGGGTYQYNDVPPAAFKKLRTNKSVGKTINKTIKGGGYEYEKVGKQKSYTCRFCKEPATKGILWAEGRGIIPCCDKHLAKGKTEVVTPGGAKDPDGIDGIRDLTKTSSQAASIAARFTQRRRQMAKMAGGCKKQITWQGLTMKLEYLKGDERSGVNGATGKSWSRTMKDNYGYMPGTYGKGADGEAIDVYFSPKPSEEGSRVVYKIRQKKKTGEYDEDKFMVGYGSGDEAKKAFLRNMPEWAFDSMTGMSMGRFRKIVGQETSK